MSCSCWGNSPVSYSAVSYFSSSAGLTLLSISVSTHLHHASVTPGSAVHDFINSASKFAIDAASDLDGAGVVTGVSTLGFVEGFSTSVISFSCSFISAAAAVSFFALLRLLFFDCYK